MIWRIIVISVINIILNKYANPVEKFQLSVKKKVNLDKNVKIRNVVKVHI